MDGGAGYRGVGGGEHGSGDIAPPGWPKWVGILTIVYAVFMFGCLGLMTAAAFLFQGMVEQGLDGDPMPEAMKVGALDVGLMLVGLITNVALLFGGIFCTMRRPVSRWLLAGYGLVSIPVSLGNYVYQLGKQESLRKWAETYPDNQVAQGIISQQQTGAAAVQEMVTLVLMIVMGVLIPLFYLIWFGFVKTRREQYEGSDVGVY